MNHLNKWDWFSWTDVYQTYDYLECPNCKATAVEIYHTEFIDIVSEYPKVEINLLFNK